jgi:hypothetical protein
MSVAGIHIPDQFHIKDIVCIFSDNINDGPVRVGCHDRKCVHKLRGKRIFQPVFTDT